MQAIKRGLKPVCFNVPANSLDQLLQRFISRERHHGIRCGGTSACFNAIDE
jgi:hypothetical protein